MSINTDKELNNSENSFLIKIKYRQNSSWQGSVQWIETGKTQNFKSCLELIRLMDIAVNTKNTEDTESEEPKSVK